MDVFCLTFLVGLAVYVVGIPMNPGVHLSEVFTNRTTLTVTKIGETEQAVNLTCTLKYHKTGSIDGEKYVSLRNDKITETVTLTGLQPGTSYTVILQCQQIKSDLTFQTVAEGETTPSSDPEVVFKESQLFTATTLDIVLGVLFGIVALCIVSVTLLYLYRRHQRRRRLRNFLSTPHTDPFESLQDYVE